MNVTFFKIPNSDCCLKTHLLGNHGSIYKKKYSKLTFLCLLKMHIKFTSPEFLYSSFPHHLRSLMCNYQIFFIIFFWADSRVLTGCKAHAIICTRLIFMPSSSIALSLSSSVSSSSSASLLYFPRYQNKPHSMRFSEIEKTSDKQKKY